MHGKEQRDAEHQRQLEAVADSSVDLVEMEKDKIKGAIRTDFILSAEIIVIVLGTVQNEPFTTQIAVLSGLAILFTVGVYGLVAGIVKLDDAGLYLLRKSVSGSFNRLQRALGRGILIIAPKLMRTLSIVGTAAMFLVGGGILVHSVPAFHHLSQDLTAGIANSAGNWSQSVSPIIFDGLAGVISGAIVLAIVMLISKLRHKNPKT